MSSTEATQLYGQEHVRRYRETDGDVGHIWKEGSTILLLTTTGRRTGRETTTPLIYGSTATRPSSSPRRAARLITQAGSRTSPRRPRSASRSGAIASARVRAWRKARIASGSGS